MGTSCGIIKKPETGSRQVILPLRKIVYQHLPTLSQMRKCGIGPFFRMNILSRFGDDLEKWNRMVSQHESENFPLESYISTESAHRTFAKRLEKGPPPQYRWQAWIAIRKLSSKIDEDAYEDLPRADRTTEDRILREVVLLYPFEDYYHNAESGESGRNTLFLVLSKLVRKYPGVNIFNGFQYVIGFLLLVSGGNEVEVFYFVEDLLRGAGLMGFYAGRCGYLKKCRYVFGECLKKHLPALQSSIEASGVPDECWIQKWLATLFSAVLPLEAVVRIWDVFLSQGVRILFKIGIVLLREKQYELIPMRQRELQDYFSQTSSLPLDIESLIRKAFKVSISIRKIAQLEEAFQRGSEKDVSPHADSEFPSIVCLPRVASVIEIKAIPPSDAMPAAHTAVVFKKVNRRNSRTFISQLTSKVPVLPKITSRNHGTVFTWEGVSADEEGSDEEKPIAARDVLEDMLERRDSVSVMSLDSLSNLPAKGAPKVDEYITFVNRLPV